MSFDGIVVKSLVAELREKLIDTKIDKVYQPEKDEICLKIRSKEGAHKLILSASASHPRAYIANRYEKSNPKKAPVFCMTLRKYIQGGVIVDIDQVGFERIIKISVESYDELREKTRKNLYIEIMGKHSNIILVADQEAKVIDSIKRVPLSVSRARQVLPGAPYELPPSQDKLNPLERIDVDKFTLRVNRSKGPVYKAIYSSILGLSPLVAREVCSRIDIDQNKDTEDLSNGEIRSLADCINSIFDDLDEGRSYPNIIVDDKRDKIVEFSSIRLSQYQGLREIHHDSISTIIEDYYISKDNKERISQKASSMKKNLSLKLDRIKHKIEKQELELKESENADKYENKKEIKYTVEEEKVEGYETKVEGYNIKNSYTPEKTEVKGEKTWDDENDKDKIRPASITVRLYANDKEVANVVLDKNNNWRYTWKALDKYENGKEIKYTVKEDKVKGYETTIDDKDTKNIIIKNSHKPEKPKKPDTSDHSDIMMQLIMMIGSLLGMVLIARKKMNA